MANNDLLGGQDGAGGPVELTLSNGQAVNVYPVSYRLYQTIEERYREPEVPIKKVETIDGHGENIPDPQNPEYLAALAKVREAKAKALMRLVVAQGLRGLQVPEANGWVKEVQLIDPEYQPPPDPIDLKIDYLELAFPFSGIDWQAVTTAAISSNVLGSREVEQAVSRFRNQVSREAGKDLGDALFAIDLLNRTGADADGKVGADSVDGVSQPAEGGQGRTTRRKKG